VPETILEAKRNRRQASKGEGHFTLESENHYIAGKGRGKQYLLRSLLSEGFKKSGTKGLRLKPGAPKNSSMKETQKPRMQHNKEKKKA